MKEINRPGPDSLGKESDEGGENFTNREEGNSVHTRSSDHDTEGVTRRSRWKDGTAEGEQARNGDDFERRKDRPSDAMPSNDEETIGIP
jgi:hypothetical protein